MAHSTWKLAGQLSALGSQLSAIHTQLVSQSADQTAISMQAEGQGDGIIEVSEEVLKEFNRVSKKRYGQCVEGVPLPEEGKHTATVIFLHGLGDSGFGWAPVAKSFEMPWVKFIFPTAPVQPVTLNMGMEMPAWFDITTLDPESKEEDAGGILSSAGYIMSLVDKEVANGIPRDRIVIAGFSQGGVIALTAGTAAKDVKFAGVIALSTWLPFLALPCQKETPVFMGHGDEDNVVLYRWGQESYHKILDQGINVEFNTYAGMQHGFCPEELTDCIDFLKKVLPEQ